MFTILLLVRFISRHCNLLHRCVIYFMHIHCVSKICTNFETKYRSEL